MRRAPARRIRPLYNPPPHLRWRWSTLTYILSTAKMSRFLPCRISASGIRQGGVCGAAANVKMLRGCHHVDETHRRCQVRTGGVHRGGCLRARERASKHLPCADFFGYFLVRRQESNTYSLTEKRAMKKNLRNFPQFYFCIHAQIYCNPFVYVL